jgi:hypothetical protein
VKLTPGRRNRQLIHPIYKALELYDIGPQREGERKRERNHKEVMKIFNSNLVKGVKEWFEIIKKNLFRLKK